MVYYLLLSAQTMGSDPGTKSKPVISKTSNPATLSNPSTNGGIRQKGGIRLCGVFGQKKYFETQFFVIKTQDILIDDLAQASTKPLCLSQYDPMHFISPTKTAITKSRKS